MTAPIGRPANWHHRLMQYAAAQQGQPFVWGQTDCGSLVRGALPALYAEDPLAGWPGYHTVRAAQRIRAQCGGVAAVLRQLGATPIAPGFATAGDVACCPAAGPADPERAVLALDGGWLVTDPAEGVRVVARIAWPAETVILRLPVTVTPPPWPGSVGDVG